MFVESGCRTNIQQLGYHFEKSQRTSQRMVRRCTSMSSHWYVVLRPRKNSQSWSKSFFYESTSNPLFSNPLELWFIRSSSYTPNYSLNALPSPVGSNTQNICSMISLETIVSFSRVPFRYLLSSIRVGNLSIL